MRRRALIATTVLAALAPSLSPGLASATRTGRRPITIEWVGDIALSSERGLPPGGLTEALAPVRRLLRASDLTLGNLEGTLSVGGTSKCSGVVDGHCYAFQAPRAYAGRLRSLGFGDLNLANNHALDYGPAGRAQTIGALSAAGITHDGMPGQIAIRHVHGRRVAILGFAPYPYDASLLDIPAARTLVRRARRRASLVVVIIHAGAEGVGQLHTPYGEQYFLGEDRGNARAFAHAVINAGASIVLGSGPHVIRGIERYRGRLIAYSLGNFVGYHTLAGGGVLSESAVLRVTLGPGGRVVRGRWISIHLDSGLPRRDRSNASARLMRTLSREDFGRRRFVTAPNGVIGSPVLSGDTTCNGECAHTW